VVERGDTLTIHTLAQTEADWGSVVISAVRSGGVTVDGAADARTAAPSAIGIGGTFARSLSGLMTGAR
jgi:hypothetical protein